MSNLYEKLNQNSVVEILNVRKKIDGKKKTEKTKKKKAALINIYRSKIRDLKIPEKKYEEPENKTIYCSEKNLWLSIDIRDIVINNVAQPSKIDPLVLKKSKEYKTGNYIFIAEPGKDWELYLLQNKIAVQAKAFDKEFNISKKKLFNQTKTWFTAQKGKNKILYKKIESPETFDRLRTLIGGLAPNGFISFIKEEPFVEKFGDFGFN